MNIDLIFSFLLSALQMMPGRRKRVSCKTRHLSDDGLQYGYTQTASACWRSCWFCLQKCRFRLQKRTIYSRGICRQWPPREAQPLGGRSHWCRNQPDPITSGKRGMAEAGVAHGGGRAPCHGLHVVDEPTRMCSSGELDGIPPGR
ncbi:hypothetical protein D1007_32554 [Hordeum vulgare]|nr:hypothetical protein D1007_32554 [Hordeum vulgare]